MCSELMLLSSSNAAVAVIVGVLWSIITEKLPLAQWSFAAKRILVFGLCLVVPIGALLFGAFLWHCPGMAVTFQSVLVALETGCVAFTSSQIAHLQLRDTSYD